MVSRRRQLDVFTRVGLGRICAACGLPEVAGLDDPLAALSNTLVPRYEPAWRARLFAHLELGLRCGYLQLTSNDVGRLFSDRAFDKQLFPTLVRSFLDRNNGSRRRTEPASQKALAAFETYFRIAETVQHDSSIMSFLLYANGRSSSINVDPIVFASPATFAEALMSGRVHGIPVGDQIAGGVALAQVVRRFFRLLSALEDLPNIRDGMVELATWSYGSWKIFATFERWRQMDDDWPAGSLPNETTEAYASFVSFAAAMSLPTQFSVPPEVTDFSGDKLKELIEGTQKNDYLQGQIKKFVIDALLFQQDEYISTNAIEQLFNLGERDKAALLMAPILRTLVESKRLERRTISILTNQLMLIRHGLHDIQLHQAPATREQSQTAESTDTQGSFDPSQPSPSGKGTNPLSYIEVADHIEMGRLVVRWTVDPKSRPSNVEELKQQFDGIATVPERFKYVQFVKGTLDTLILRLPIKEILEESLDRMSDPMRVQEYPLPQFYHDYYNPGFGPVMTALDTLFARVGDYTIAQSR